MKNKTYSIRKVSVGIVSIIIGLSAWEIGTVNAATNFNISTSSKIIIDKDGVRPIIEPNSSEHVKEGLVRKPSIKPALKPTEKPVEKPLGESAGKPTVPLPIKPAPKPTQKPVEKSLGEPSGKPTVPLPVKPAEKPVEKPLGKSLDKSTEKPKEKSTTNFLETDSKVEIKNDVLVGNLSGREIKVSFKKGSVSAEKLYVESLNDNDLNQNIKNKLGSDYNIIETFEIHFEKDDKRVDSNVERTVTVAVVKKDNTELEVYHIADENTLEKVNSSYSTGELKFNINHFSKFTIVERIRIGSRDLEERTQIVIPEKIEDKEKENNELPETNSIKNEKQLNILPKTGISVNSFISIGFILIIVASIIRKKLYITK